MEKLISDHGHFSSYEGHMERRAGKIRGAFSRMHRALDDWMLARAPASTAQGLCYEPLERFIGILEPRQNNGDNSAIIPLDIRNGVILTSRRAEHPTLSPT